MVPATPAAAGIVPSTAVKATPMDTKAEKGDQLEKPKCQLPQKPVNFFGTAMPRPAIAKDGKFDDDFVLPNDPLLRESLDHLQRYPDECIDNASHSHCTCDMLVSHGRKITKDREQPSAGHELLLEVMQKVH